MLETSIYSGEGYNGRHHGMKATNNPYLPSTLAHDMWMNGWRMANQEIKKEARAKKERNRREDRMFADLHTDFDMPMPRPSPVVPDSEIEEVRKALNEILIQSAPDTTPVYVTTKRPPMKVYQTKGMYDDTPPRPTTPIRRRYNGWKAAIQAAENIVKNTDLTVTLRQKDTTVTITAKWFASANPLNLR